MILGTTVMSLLQNMDPKFCFSWILYVHLVGSVISRNFITYLII